ncbi:MAG: glycine cleavage system aminomethyltransferase GcvT [Actinomycetota bacterium]
MSAPAGLRESPLAARHRDAGARFTEFAGWELPVHYGSQIAEHHAVRERAGLFDISHMGQTWVTGRRAAEGLGYALVSDPESLAVGRAEYSMICVPDGGVIDDLIVYRLGEERFLVVANASNDRVVASELKARLEQFDSSVSPATMETAMLALQGPDAEGILADVAGEFLGGLPSFAAAEGKVGATPALVARTGYTGEDGFEILMDWDDAGAIWDLLLEAGASRRLVPAGLGARDTLRLEAGLPLYGNELDLETNPFEAGLGRFVKLGKPSPFVGRDALEKAAAHSDRRQIGLKMRGRGIARHGYPVYRPGAAEALGTVTSGAPSPTLGVPIALASARGGASKGSPVEVEIRGRRIEAEIVRLPFYRRQRRVDGDSR